MPSKSLTACLVGSFSDTIAMDRAEKMTVKKDSTEEEVAMTAPEVVQKDNSKDDLDKKTEAMVKASMEETKDKNEDAMEERTSEKNVTAKIADNSKDNLDKRMEAIVVKQSKVTKMKMLVEVLELEASSKTFVSQKKHPALKAFENEISALDKP